MTKQRDQRTPKQKKAQTRAERNRKARERHWRNTGVSEATIQWMKDRDML